jgi:spore cortex protein
MLILTLSGCSDSTEGRNGNMSQTDITADYKDDLVTRINDPAPIPHIYHDLAAIERKQEAIESEGGNPTIPLSEYGDGIFYQDQEHSTRDRNYHGHLSEPRKTQAAYYNSYQGELVDKIRKRLNGLADVQDSRAVIYKREIIVTALLRDYDKTGQIKGKIIKIVRLLINDLKLHVTTDKNVYHRSVTLDNMMRTGTSKEMFKRDAADMFKNINRHENHPQ